MRVLIDECVDQESRLHSPIKSLHGSLTNIGDGEPLAVAQIEFNVLLHKSTKMEFQQNLTKLRIWYCCGHVAKNQLVHYVRIEPELLSAIARIRPGN